LSDDLSDDEDDDDGQQKTIENDNATTNMCTMVDSDAHAREDAEQYQQTKNLRNDETDNMPKRSSTKKNKENKQ
jgi:hypothetical protein